MTRLPRRSLLAVSLAAALGAGSALPVHAVIDGDRAAARVPADSAGRPMHVIDFVEPGALEYDGGIDGMRGTSRRATGRLSLDAQSPEVREYVAFLDRRQAAQIAAIEQAIGRPLDVRYNYHYTHNGIGTFLSPAEAAIVANLPGVSSVRIDEVFQLADERSPQFLGAPTLWDGSNSGTTPPTATRGQGIIVGIFDSGMNLSHPSYANDPSCGHGPTNPKMVRTFDCGAGNCVSGQGNDGNGHGSHVAGSAIGNSLAAGVGTPAPDRDISGQAPCARVINFLVCPSSCPGTAIQAAINTAIALPTAEKIRVANFSLGPSLGPNPIRNPWTQGSADSLARPLANDNVFVAFAAGNTRADQPITIGSVVNVAPWVTTVANSTNDNRGRANLLDLIPGGPQDVPAIVGGPTQVPPSGITADVADAAGAPFNAALACAAQAASFPPGSMAGRIALVDRGTCPFQEKVQTVQNAGAVAVIVVNNVPDPPIPMGGITATIPASMVSQADGAAIRGFLSTPGAQMVIPAPTILTDPAFANILSGGSLRGPVNGFDVVKPDITAPGSNNYDAYTAPSHFSVLSGTSMASPQIAGGAALIRAIHPNWTPMEVQSAMLLTGSLGNQRLPNGVTPATADDVGSGMVDFRRAARAGFVLHVTDAEFSGANPAVNPAATRQLNLANMMNRSCNASCGWTRTVRNTRTSPVTWTASFVNPPDVTLSIDTPSFSFTGGLGETQTFRVTATITPGVTLAANQYGQVIFTPNDATLPPLVMNVVVRGSNPNAADSLLVDGFEPND
jgi:subtilisin family serine protease